LGRQAGGKIGAIPVGPDISTIEEQKIGRRELDIRPHLKQTHGVVAADSDGKLARIERHIASDLERAGERDGAIAAKPDNAPVADGLAQSGFGANGHHIGAATCVEDG